MRKTKKVNASFDAINSLTPEEAGELLAAEEGTYQTMKVGSAISDSIDPDGTITKKFGSVDLGDLT